MHIRRRDNASRSATSNKSCKVEGACKTGLHITRLDGDTTQTKGRGTLSRYGQAKT